MEYGQDSEPDYLSNKGRFSVKMKLDPDVISAVQKAYRKDREDSRGFEESPGGGGTLNYIQPIIANLRGQIARCETVAEAVSIMDRAVRGFKIRGEKQGPKSPSPPK